MRLHFFLALILASAVVTAQTLDSHIDVQRAAPDAPSEAPPPDTSDVVPLSAFEAIQAPPSATGVPDHRAGRAPPVRLQLDANLKHMGPSTPPPPIAPRIPGREPDEPRAPAPSDWR